MNPSPAVRYAYPGDARAIATLIEAARDARLPALPSACVGFEEYVRQQIQCPREFCESVFVVCEREGVISACAEFRRLASLFLNHIVVRNDLRGCGLGRLLLRDGIRLCDDGTRQVVELDVVQDNVRPRDWYSSLGFECLAVTEISELLSHPAPALRDAVVSDIPQADAVQAAFGFSKIRVTTGLSSYEVGRLGASWFRLVGDTCLGDMSLLATLCRLEPQRRIVVYHSPESSGPAAGGRLVTMATTMRMAAPLKLVVDGLQADAG